MRTLNLKILLTTLFAVVLSLAGCDKNTGTPPLPGPKWRVFTKETSPLVDNSINTISIDAGGKIWFGTNGGASVLRATIWKSYVDELAYQDFSQTGNPVSHIVNAITNAVDGSTWFGLAGGGLRRFLPTSPNQQWTPYTTNISNISGDNVLQLAADRSGIGGNSNIWCGFGFGGVSRFKPNATDPLNGDWIRYTTSDGLASDNIYSVQTNLIQHTVWFGSDLGDLSSFNGEAEWHTETVPAYNGKLKCISFEGAGLIWIGTVDGAFRRGIGWDKFTTADGLPSNNIYSIAVDVHSNKWFGSDGGLTRFDNSSWSTFNRANSPLPNDTVKALGIDTDGKIWIGTANGAAVYDPLGK